MRVWMRFGQCGEEQPVRVAIVRGPNCNRSFERQSANGKKHHAKSWHQLEARSGAPVDDRLILVVCACTLDTPSQFECNLASRPSFGDGSREDFRYRNMGLPCRMGRAAD